MIFARANGRRGSCKPLVLTLAIACLWSTRTLAETLRPADERFADPEVTEVPNFQRHVVPLLGRLGCNGRACHGSFQGQAGFRLSLFGYDFQLDHEALTGGESPRVNREVAAASKILEKGTLEIPHKGGKRMEPGGWEYRMLARWIEAGAPGAEPLSTLAALEAEPKEIRFAKPEERTRFRVIARWADGSAEDVTRLCRFSTNNDEIADVDADGGVVIHKPGDTDIVACYDNGVATVQVLLPVSDKLGEAYPEVPTPTKIDQLVAEKHRKMGLVPSELSSDTEFLRRVSLDIAGVLPTPVEIDRFVQDTGADKRERKIDELLARPAHASWWATKLCDWTGNNEASHENPFRGEIAREWHEWIERRLLENKPYDQIVAGILLAKGRREGQDYSSYVAEMSSYTRREAPADFAARPDMPHYWARRGFRTAEERALGVAHSFLGVRIQCAQCHKHPFDQWTQGDFDRFAAFFDRVLYGVAPASRPQFKALNEETGIEKLSGKEQRDRQRELALAGKPIPWKEVFLTPPPNPSAAAKAEQKKKEKGKKPQPVARNYMPKLLGGEEVIESQYDDPRQAVMEWLRSPDNPYFASAVVNRVWAHYFGVGIIEPADDQNLANPPSNPALLDYLRSEFVAKGYDLKWLHREITRSRTYQLSWRPNETNRLDERNFSRAQFRRLPAEVTYDAILVATASGKVACPAPSGFAGRAIAASSNEEMGNARFALVAFGKPPRATTCDCERSSEPNLQQSIYLRNDQDIFRFLDRADGWLAELAEKHGMSKPTPVPEAEKEAKKLGKYRPSRSEQIAKLTQRAKKFEEQGLADAAAQLRQRIERLSAMADQTTAEKPAPSPNSGDPSVVARDDSATPTTSTPAAVPVAEVDQTRAITEAYLRTVSRYPTDAEMAKAKAYVGQSANFVSGLRDVLWALLNTKEFIVNH